MTTMRIDGNVNLNNMEDKKELPKFIFKFPLTGDERTEEKTIKLLKEAFGERLLVLFAEDNLEMYQLEDTYKKII